MPERHVFETCKRTRNFINSQGIPRYCSLVNGEEKPVLTGGRSKRGKYRGPPGTKPLTSALRYGGSATGCAASEDACFVDFLQRCLRFDPTQRMTPAEGLRHRWIRRKSSDVAPIATTVDHQRRPVHQSEAALTQHNQQQQLQPPHRSNIHASALPSAAQSTSDLFNGVQLQSIRHHNRGSDTLKNQATASSSEKENFKSANNFVSNFNTQKRQRVNVFHRKTSDNLPSAVGGSLLARRRNAPEDRGEEG